MRSVLFLVAAVFLAPRLADACSCVAQTPAQLYERAAVVFVGDLVELTETPRRKTARMRVVRAYKGDVKSDEVVTVTLPGGTSASCSLDLTAKARVVVFANAADGRLSTNLCSGTYQLEPGKPLPNLPPV